MDSSTPNLRHELDILRLDLRFFLQKRSGSLFVPTVKSVMDKRFIAGVHAQE